MLNFWPLLLQSDWLPGLSKAVLTLTDGSILQSYQCWHNLVDCWEWHLQWLEFSQFDPPLTRPGWWKWLRNVYFFLLSVTHPRDLGESLNCWLTLAGGFVLISHHLRFVSLQWSYAKYIVYVSLDIWYFNIWSQALFPLQSFIRSWQLRNWSNLP